MGSRELSDIELIVEQYGQLWCRNAPNLVGAVGVTAVAVAAQAEKLLAANPGLKSVEGAAAFIAGSSLASGCHQTCSSSLMAAFISQYLAAQVCA